MPGDRPNKTAEHIALIAEDDPHVRMLLEYNLTEEGYRTIAVDNGIDAISRLSDDVTVVLLDLNMPGCGGIECLEYVQTYHPEISCIVVTAISDVRTVVEAVKKGAFDYIIKPIDIELFLTHVDRAAKATLQARRLRNAERSLAELLQREHEIAADVQKTLLLRNPPANIAGLDIGAFAVPSMYVNGDICYFIHHGPKCIDVIVGDVMGRGVSAALTGSALISEIFRALFELNRGCTMNDLPSPQKVISLVVANIAARLAKLEAFVTLCYARFDLFRSTMTFVDCGHTPTVHWNSDQDAPIYLKGNNMPVGFSELDNIQEVVVPFQKGDFFLFYSDGLTEAENPEGERFGKDRLVECVTPNHKKTAKAIIGQLRTDFFEYIKDDQAHDDISCVAVRIVETCKNPGGCRSERVFPAQLAQLAEVRRFFRHFCQTKGDLRLSVEQLDRFELALNEVVSNVIRHSFAEAADREFILNLCACAGRMEAMVVHNGTRYSPSPVVRPPEGSLEESGYGLSIIKQAVDEVLYDTDDAGRNTIFLSTKEH